MESTVYKRSRQHSAENSDEFQHRYRRRSQNFTECMTEMKTFHQSLPETSNSLPQGQYDWHQAVGPGLFIPPINISSDTSAIYSVLPAPTGNQQYCAPGFLAPHNGYRDAVCTLDSVSRSSRPDTPCKNIPDYSPSSSPCTVQNQYLLPLDMERVIDLQNWALPEVLPDYEMQVDHQIDKEICYGMIKVYAQWNMTGTLEDTRTAIMRLQDQILNIQQWEGVNYVLESEEYDEPIAIIDTISGEHIAHLINHPEFKTLRFQVDLSDLSPSDISIHDGEESPTFPLNINIYGLYSTANTVGREMSRMKVYLQQPSYIDPGLDYDNPHYFKQPGQKTPWVQPSLVEAANITKKDQMPGVLSGVLDSQLTRSNLLMELEMDTRIVKTPLLKHQKQALDFITQRESGITQDAYSLWRLTGTTNSRYCNLLSGVEQFQTPEEARGGIIADEVGLGKTLTMISVVARSLEEAKQYTSQSSHIQLPRTSATITLPRAKSTLIIVPVSLLVQWAEQIQMHTNESSLSYFTYHGSSREVDLHEYDFIFTTYEKVASDYDRHNGRRQSPLYSKNWFRIVLDEAHQIRNTGTKQFRAISSLRAQRRWCLTATPIQNSLDDIGALFQFLQVEPVQTKQLFKRHIIDPLKSNCPLADSETKMRNLRLLLTTYCLRRKQSTLSQFVKIEVQEIVRRLHFTATECQNYGILKIECNSALEKAMCSSIEQGYFSVLQAILRLRIFCNTGMTILSTETEGSTCPYCGGQIDTLPASETEMTNHSLPCGHLVCVACSGRHIDMEYLDIEKPKKYNCFTCQQKSKPAQKESGMWVSPVNRAIGTFSFPTLGVYPSKIIALLEDIRNNPRGEKSIVFSSWRRSLEVVQVMLKEHGIGYVLIDGKLNIAERNRTLAKFRQDSSTMVLLMTTGTGAAGLNLTIATRIHLLEPQWNPMVEVQAIGRVARLGQTKCVTVYRYIVTSSIEENVKSRQRKKVSMAEIAIDLDNISKEKRKNFISERLNDLQSLL